MNIIIAFLLFFSLDSLASVNTTEIYTTSYGNTTSQGYYVSDFWLNVTQSGGYSGSDILYTPYQSGKQASISITTVTADNPGMSLFLVGAGQEFTNENITSGLFPLISYSWDGSTFTNISRFNSGVFYLGVWSGVRNTTGSYPDGYTVDRSRFGWAKFSFNATGIKMLSSAMTGDQAGIIVGTLNTIPFAVPEPETDILFVVGLSILFIRLRFRKDPHASPTT